MSILDNIFAVVWLPLMIGSIAFIVSLVFAYLWFDHGCSGCFFVVMGLWFVAGLAFYFMDWGTLHTVVSDWIGQVVG